MSSRRCACSMNTINVMTPTAITKTTRMSGGLFVFERVCREQLPQLALSARDSGLVGSRPRPGMTASFVKRCRAAGVSPRRVWPNSHSQVTRTKVAFPTQVTHTKIAFSITSKPPDKTGAIDAAIIFCGRGCARAYSGDRLRDGAAQRTPSWN
jgi:hypothetical protein